jgi:hypothetical protein
MKNKEEMREKIKRDKKTRKKMVVLYLRRLVACFPPRRPGFYPKSDHVGFMVDKVTLTQVFSEYFGFSCQFSFHQPPHIPLFVLSPTPYNLDTDSVIK